MNSVARDTLMAASRDLFSAHGRFTINKEGTRLLIDAVGPFNLEIVVKYDAAVKRAITDLNDKNWTLLSVLHGMSILTPEAEEKLESAIKYRLAHGMLASATVVGDVDGRIIVAQQVERMHQKCKSPHLVTNSIEEAKSWLDDYERNSLTE